VTSNSSADSESDEPYINYFRECCSWLESFGAIEHLPLIQEQIGLAQTWVSEHGGEHPDQKEKLDDSLAAIQQRAKRLAAGLSELVDSITAPCNGDAAEAQLAPAEAKGGDHESAA
jgi:hypothetical protein